MLKRALNVIKLNLEIQALDGNILHLRTTHVG